MQAQMRQMMAMNMLEKGNFSETQQIPPRRPPMRQP
jgi:hypothetical protein